MRGRPFAGRILLLLCALLFRAALPAAAEEAARPLRVLRTASGARIKTLDPALADDLASRNMCAAVYDTLLQYDYTARPYTLTPSMLAEMPRSDGTMSRYRFRLRDDLFFAGDRCFGGEPAAARKVGSRDVLYSILRIADPQTHSPVYWMFRDKISGLDEFRNAADKTAFYRDGFSGFRIINDLEFEIVLTRPDPRFLYMLAMPNSGIVPRRAVEFYQGEFERRPVGSGPFVLRSWQGDYKIVLERNADFRREFFPAADDPADRTRPLPLLDRVECCLVKQPMTAWLLFLQGELDMHALDKDNLDLVAGGGATLAPALAERGIKLIRQPEFEIRYIGFNFDDPVLGKNPALRRALSLAYNVQRRVEHSGYQLIPAQGPIPPGVAGFDPEFVNPWCADDLDRAREELKKSGLDATALQFTFDQNGNTPSHRQLGELTADDFAKLGVSVTPVLNNSPRFFEKLRQGKAQLFRLSWVGDYPDAENFLQLFYSKNAGGCNRTNFSDPEFDAMFEEILPMADSPERTEKYRRMCRLLADRSPWIFESFPISYQLNHAWLQNFTPHDFGFNKWKFLAVDAPRREVMKKSFTGLKFSELNP